MGGLPGTCTPLTAGDRGVPGVKLPVQPWAGPIDAPVSLPQPGSTVPVNRLSPYTAPWRSPISTAGPLSSNSTGDDKATPHGASLRTVPAPAFHVSVSVNVVAAPDDTVAGATITPAMHTPVTVTPVSRHRVAIVRAVFTLFRLSCLCAAKLENVVLRAAPENGRFPNIWPH